MSGEGRQAPSLPGGLRLSAAVRGDGDRRFPRSWYRPRHPGRQPMAGDQHGSSAGGLPGSSLVPCDEPTCGHVILARVKPGHGGLISSWRAPPEGPRGLSRPCWCRRHRPAHRTSSPPGEGLLFPLGGKTHERSSSRAHGAASRARRVTCRASRRRPTPMSRERETPKLGWCTSQHLHRPLRSGDRGGARHSSTSTTSRRGREYVSLPWPSG